MTKLTINEKIMIEGHDSKGDQLKFRHNDRWFKVDRMGYEGLAEAVVSNILQKSNIENFVPYKEELIEYNDRVYHGCSSPDFKPDEMDIVTADKLLRANYGKGTLDVCRQDSLEDTISCFVQTISKLTKISEEEMGKYLTSMLELDALVLNEDRHFNNIAFLRYNGMYMPAPLFDHGASLLSDTTYFHLNRDTEDLIRRVDVKPFCKSFEKQVQAVENLFGKQLQLDIENIWECIPEDSVYPLEIRERVEDVLEIQREKYSELFVSEPTLEEVIEKARKDAERAGQEKAVERGWER